MSRTLEVVLDGCAYLESPRWHDGRLWASDFYTSHVLATVPGQLPSIVLQVPEQPSGLGWMPNGDLLVVSMRDRLLLRWDGTATTVHADLSTLAPSHLNDMVVDSWGRAYVGNFGADMLAGERVRPTNLIKVEPDGSAMTVAENLHFPNGMVITPDGRTLIVAESFAGRLTAFDVATDGSLSGRRDWAVLSRPPVGTTYAAVVGDLEAVPDGLTMDAEGAIWAADPRGPRVVRIKDGRVVEEVSTRSTKLLAISCALGGEDGRTLFVCANPVSGDREASLAAMRASVLALRVDVPHAGRP